MARREVQGKHRHFSYFPVGFCSLNPHLEVPCSSLTVCKLFCLQKALTLNKEPDISVSIVSDYGLDDRAIEVRSPGGAKDFSSSLCAHTDSGAHPASYPMGTGGPFPGGKARPVRDADHSPPSSAEVVNE
jgi:hypothetical protein